MRKFFYPIISSMLLILLLSFSCSTKKDDNVVGDIPSAMLLHLESHNIQAVRVYQNNELRMSYDQGDWDTNSLHKIYSCTKSVISLLIGTLIDSGVIESVEVPMVDLFPDLDISVLPKSARDLKLKHFLTMTTGLRSRDSYLYNWAGLQAVRNDPNWVESVLKLKQEDVPGARFDYSNLASFTLGEVIHSLTGKDVSLYAEEVLFEPLGITEYEWDKNPYGASIGWGGLHLHPDDLVKIGLLVLNHGVWEGEMIVSEQWLDISTTSKIKSDTLRENYGYQWWVDSEERILALGYQGQYLIIDPELNLVTVVLSELDTWNFFLPYRMYISHIIKEFD